MVRVVLLSLVATALIGAQAAVVAHYPDLLFLSIETSGEGDINAYSRVQMALGEAKVKCKDEFRRAVASTGHSLDELRAANVARTSSHVVRSNFPDPRGPERFSG